MKIALSVRLLQMAVHATGDAAVLIRRHAAVNVRASLLLPLSQRLPARGGTRFQQLLERDEVGSEAAPDGSGHERRGDASQKSAG